jgi:hypothetical protein
MHTMSILQERMNLELIAEPKELASWNIPLE